jgi:uncharacterized protein YjiS (DUF1127 family)
MSWAAWVIVATCPLLGLAISRVASVWVVIARLLRTWQGRELQRRELSVLSSRDFGDLAVPQSLINEEIRRWPGRNGPSPFTTKLDGPWDLTIDDQFDHARVFVSNVLNGTVTRLDLTITASTVMVKAATVIAARYTSEENDAALEKHEVRSKENRSPHLTGDRDRIGDKQAPT